MGEILGLTRMIGSSPVKSRQQPSFPCHERPPPRTRIHKGWGVRRLVGSGSTGLPTSRSFPMPSTHPATALVVPFEQLRMTDVESVGGKNASLGEMISQLAQTGVRV